MSHRNEVARLGTLFTLVLMGTCLLAAGVRRTEAAGYDLRAALEPRERTKILVLGTEHLRGLGDAFEPTLLDALLRDLEKFGPDVIAVEAMPPAEIDRLVRSATDSTGAEARILAAFAGDAARYGGEAQAALGLTYEEAGKGSGAARPASPTPRPEERRRVALRMLASYDVPSAVLQWSYLPAKDRVPQGAVSPSIAEFLNGRLSGPDETVTIGVALAHRRNLQGIASIDDHVDDEVGLATGSSQELMQELDGTAAFEDLRKSSYFDDAQRRLPDAAATGDLLSLYLEINSPEHLNKDVDAQWHLFYRTHLKSNLDRDRAALWEARNLNIASHIRQASASHSGGRVLVVIGAAHKPFLDQYLAAMMDVDVVQLPDVLGPR
jgi:Family of unknown function (DUF5694)